MSSWPGRWRNLTTQNSTTTSTSTKTGIDATRSTSNRSETCFACLEASGGNQSIASAMAIPMIDAIKPITSICTSCLRTREESLRHWSRASYRDGSPG